MSAREKSSGLLLLVALAFVGFLLITVPTLVFRQWTTIQQASPMWAYVYLATVGTGLLLVFVYCLLMFWRLWSAGRKKRLRRQQVARNPSELTLAEREKEVEENLAAIEDLKSDPAVADELRREIEPLVDKLETKRESRSLEIVAFGTISSGKSSLLNALAGRDVFATDASGGTTLVRNEVPWPGADKVVLVDTPGLGEVGHEERQSVSAAAAGDADLVLLVVDGPLRESEFDLLAQLGRMEKHVLVCLNKEDWYDQADRDALLRQIAEQVKDAVRPEDVLAVRSSPTSRARVRVGSDQTPREETT